MGEARCTWNAQGARDVDAHSLDASAAAGCRELELELIQSHKAQVPMQRGEVGA